MLPDQQFHRLRLPWLMQLPLDVEFEAFGFQKN
jgi:hypothetical protein